MANVNYLRYKLLKPFKSWKNKILKSIAQKYAERRNLYNIVASEISEFTREPIEIVKQKHKLSIEAENGREIFKDQKGLSPEKVEEFYKNCTYYIYELPLWNAERGRPKYLSMITVPYLRRNKYQKALDFGGGAGDFCIELAQNNLDVTYCDISEKLYAFSAWRFNRRKLPIKMVKGLTLLGDGLYDVIFSFDAFEHIKDLPQTLGKLLLYLKQGGSLIFSGAFSGGTLHLEENEKYNEFRCLDTLMQNYGLIFHDKFSQFYFYKYIDKTY